MKKKWDTVVLDTHIDSAQDMGRCVETAEKELTSRWYAGAMMIEGVWFMKYKKKQQLKIALTW